MRRRDRHGRIAPAVLVLVILVSCATLREWGSRVEWEGVSLEELPGEDRYPDAGSIVVREEGKMEILGDPDHRTSVFSYHVIEKILNDRGHGRLNIAIPFSEGTTVEAVAARTISPEGRITVLAPDEVYEVTYYPNFIFYSDQRAKMFTMPAVEDGSIIEYRYRLRIQGSTFWHGWEFQRAQPTLHSKFTLIAPSALSVLYRMYETEIEPAVDDRVSNMKDTYVWEARDVPPLKIEYGMPPMKEVVPRVTIAPIGVETWDDVASWYGELAEPRMKAGDGIRDRVGALTEGAATDSEKLKRIYDWTLEHIRYIAVQIGQGNFQPHAAEVVLEHRYGDCKDMTTLLCAMAREAGVDARQALVSTRQNGYPDTTLPSMLQFNHAVAYSPSAGGGIFLDATDKGCPFGQISWYYQGVPVFAVDEDGTGEWVDVPSSPADGNRTEMRWVVKLEASGEAEAEGETRLSGCHAHEVRENLIYASEEERARWIESYLVERCPGIRLNAFSVEGVRPAGDPLVLTYAFATDAFAVPRDRSLVCRPGEPAAFDLSDRFRAPERTHPIRFKFEGVHEATLKLVLPEGWTTEDTPRIDSEESPFGRVDWEWTASEDTVIARHAYRMEVMRVEPPEYGAFRDFLDTVRRKDRREIVILRNDDS